MQAVPLVFLSGELQSAEQNGLCELVGGSRKRMPMLQSNIANTCANNELKVTGTINEAVYKARSINSQKIQLVRC